MHRYGYTGPGDSSSLTMNTSNVVLDRVVSLPGGVSYTVRGAGSVWSYPNLHGDVVATANSAGVKQGGTIGYDPYGNQLTGTLPDNITGNIDNAWLGQYQRPLEHAPGLVPTVEMGARPYNPTLGRFLGVDPVEGGTSNNYAYVDDPVNIFDLNGQWGWPKIPNPIKAVIDHGKKAASAVKNATVGAVKTVKSFVKENRGFLATLAASAGCLALPGGCVAFQLAAMGVRMQQRGLGKMKENLLDATVTGLTLGIGGAASIALSKQAVIVNGAAWTTPLPGGARAIASGLLWPLGDGIGLAACIAAGQRRTGC